MKYKHTSKNMFKALNIDPKEVETIERIIKEKIEKHDSNSKIFESVEKAGVSIRAKLWGGYVIGRLVEICDDPMKKIKIMLGGNL